MSLQPGPDDHPDDSSLTPRPDLGEAADAEDTVHGPGEVTEDAPAVPPPSAAGAAPPAAQGAPGYGWPAPDSPQPGYGQPGYGQPGDGAAASEPSSGAAWQAPPDAGWPPPPPPSPGYGTQGPPSQASPGWGAQPPAPEGGAWQAGYGQAGDPGQYQAPAGQGYGYPGQGYPQEPDASGAPPGYTYPPPPAVYPQAGYAYPAYAAPRQTDSKAIVALVLAISSWVVCPVITAVVALVLAGQSDRAIAASGGMLEGRSMNTATRWVAWANIVVMTLAILAAIGIAVFAISQGGIVLDESTQF